jgi:REP element-mobilizing transposase RayT
MKHKPVRAYRDTTQRNRKSIRIPGYDYSQPGWYFITICTQHRQHIFGNVDDGEMILNKSGEIAKSEWVNTINIRTNIVLDEYIIMPNHMHGIIVINNINNVGAYRDTPLQTEFKSPSKTVGAIVRGYKSTVTKQINQFRNTPGVQLWQRNYWEHIIRDETELNRIRTYIINNPLKWQDDRYSS